MEVIPIKDCRKIGGKGSAQSSHKKPAQILGVRMNVDFRKLYSEMVTSLLKASDRCVDKDTAINRKNELLTELANALEFPFHSSKLPELIRRARRESVTKL